ncbi:flagellar export chaperone FlgN [Candidatus Contubernalis alkaliaceticus]|uniref:flagellar export chaperone FlgN n=1 Tax=Candidatus Contubernalis alkaliaceticus TaxID=338645 RepID=UPI001F4C3DA5|nr:flagellar export chaperone FlgN [Candidatus Contubernalis alkalaceticus]UNC91718.1 flagellar protein FlgN [Candidatus Contubernalis alkalaceticus]
MDTGALLVLLKEEKEKLIQFIDITRREGEAIAGHNLTALQQFLGEKARVKKELKALEEERLAITGEMKLVELMELFPEGRREELAVLGKEMKEKAWELQQLSEMNILLLKSGLAYINKMQESLSPERKAKQYGKDARFNRKQQGTNFLVSSYA